MQSYILKNPFSIRPRYALKSSQTLTYSLPRHTISDFRSSHRLGALCISSPQKRGRVVAAILKIILVFAEPLRLAHSFTLGAMPVIVCLR